MDSKKTYLLNNLTLCILKPGARKHRAYTEMVDRILNRGFEIVKDETVHIQTADARSLYFAHRGQSFFWGTIEHMTSDKSRVVVLHRQSIQKTPAAEVLREMIGATNPDKAKSGTIRGDYGCQTSDGDTLIHGSKPGEVQREIELFFPEFAEKCIKDIIDSK